MRMRLLAPIAALAFLEPHRELRLSRSWQSPIAARTLHSLATCACTVQEDPVSLVEIIANHANAHQRCGYTSSFPFLDSDFEYSTQSYTGYEPTSMRAIRARYDPYEQARARIDQLKSLGHSVDKVEYIVMGMLASCVASSRSSMHSLIIIHTCRLHHHFISY